MGNVTATGRRLVEFLHFPAPPPQNPGPPAAWTTALTAETKQPLYIFFVPGKVTAICSFFPFSQITLGNWTDLSCGVGTTIVATTAGLFQKWMVGFSFVITAGTNFTPGTYLITFYLDSNHVIVNSSPCPGGVGSGGTATLNVSLMASLQIPQGGAQRVDELNGQSSIATFAVAANDPTGALKTMAADPSAVGQLTMLTVGFPGLDISQFQTLHTNRIAAVGRDSSGLVTIRVQDVLLQLVDQVFINGGPDPWRPGDPVPAQHTPPPSVRDNGVPISSGNPRYFSGNPLNLAMAVMQNELGLGQTSPPSLVVIGSGGSGTGMAGFGINPSWAFFDGINDSTLINPNPFVDVPGIIALRDSEFSGDRMEFTLTSPEVGKTFIEDQILKPLGLYFITLPTGELTLKTMKHPAATASANATAISDSQIEGIPATDRWPVINFIQATMPVDTDATTTTTMTFVNQSSAVLYKSPYQHVVTSDGMRFVYGGFGKMFLLANRIFGRHAFATPIYTFTTFFEFIGMNLGSFFKLTHPLLFDLLNNVIGVTNILCEVIDRQPDYANGKITFIVADTRFMKVTSAAYQIAAAAAAIPVWGSASAGQKAQYMFVSDNTGKMSDATPGNPIE